MVSVIYNGNDKAHIIIEGVAPINNASPGTVIDKVSQAVYDRDLKNDSRYSLVFEKKDQNKMEKSTKGVK